MEVDHLSPWPERIVDIGITPVNRNPLVKVSPVNRHVRCNVGIMPAGERLWNLTIDRKPSAQPANLCVR